jgi:Lysozyme like domain
MTVLSRAQLYQYAQAAGFSGAAADEVVAIAFAESSGDTTHVNVNGASVTKIGGVTTNVPAGTKDRGILQINDWWNSGKPGSGALVTDACAFDPTCSFKWAYGVTGGKQPTASSDPFRAYWVTVQNGAYKKYLTPGGASTSTNTSTSSTSSTPSNPGISGAVTGAISAATGSNPVAVQPVSGAIISGAASSATGATIPDVGTLESGIAGIQNNVNSLATSLGSVFSALQDIQKAGPGTLIRIGLFLLLLILLGAGLFLLANSKEL